MLPGVLLPARALLSLSVLCQLPSPGSLFPRLPLPAFASAVRPRRGSLAAMAADSHFYPIGSRGLPWGDAERVAWRAQHVVKRSYEREVLLPLEALREGGAFLVEKYGALSLEPDRYPVMVAKSKKWHEANPTVLVTGGVHGYETSGVKGALLFLQTHAEGYSDRFNFVVAPCVSPWGFEHIQRWNNNADGCALPCLSTCGMRPMQCF